MSSNAVVKAFGENNAAVAHEEREHTQSFAAKTIAAPHLHAVRQIRKNSRVVFTLACVSILAVALMAVLFLNMSVSSGQYYLVRLKQEEKSMLQNNQALRQESQNDNVSQNLAARAVELGMVPLTTAAYLNIHDGVIRGELKAAEENQRMEQNVPAPRSPPIGTAQREQTDLGGEAGAERRQEPQQVVTGGVVPSPAQKVYELGIND